MPRICQERLRPLRRLCLFLLMLSPGLPASPTFAQTEGKEKPKSKSSARVKSSKTVKKKPDKPIAPGVQTYASENFIIHTDLSEAESQDLLERLETMLELISTYWAKPNARVIEMYVVKDINAWPQGAIPAEGLDHITAGGGVTMSQASCSRDRVHGPEDDHRRRSRGVRRRRPRHAAA